MEARLLIAKAAGKTTEELMRDLNMYVTPEFTAKAEDYLSRRAEGEPVAYITGEWEFYGLPMKVTKDVLIPRTDTEVLVDKAVELLRAKDENPRVLDLCCGSGCVGIAIAANAKHSRVTMVDNSPEAIRISKYNVSLNNLAKNITCIQLDALQPPPRIMGRYDIIACNPPYIPTSDIEGLDKSVKDYEPRVALDGGEDGLDFYRSIIKNWKGVLREKGVMLFECGIGQADDIKRIMVKNGFVSVGVIKDTQNIDRVVAGIYML